MVKFLDYY
jgi:hypothetical protein